MIVFALLCALGAFVAFVTFVLGGSVAALVAMVGCTVVGLSCLLWDAWRKRHPLNS